MNKIRFEYKFTAIYIILGLLWILFSDRLLNSMITDQDYLTKIQTYKGWFYVIATALLFFFYLRMHLVKLRNAEKKAVESDRLKTAFLQNISHEIRTPMNGIIGFASLLKDDGLPVGQKREYIEIINNSSNRLLNLVNQILDISLIETGSCLVLKQPVNLNKLMDEIHDKWKPVIKNEVTFSLSRGLYNQSANIFSDEYKLRQILDNLVGNAIKFTGSGHIRLGYNLRRNELEFYIEDTGIGIPAEHQSDIFKPFRKSEPEKSRFYEGAGVGLAICKGNIELLKGKFNLQSTPGTGSKFCFTIPYEPVLSGESFPESDNNIHHSLEGLKILVAEDEMMNFSYIEELLSGSGIEIHHAINGQKAVELCKENSNYDIVLMDIRMPVMNGYEATKLIKELRPGLPVIAQTAYITCEERHKAIEVGFDAFISKPFLKEDLLEAMVKQFRKYNDLRDR